MEEAASEPDGEVETDEPSGKSDERLEVFKNFVEKLDMDDLETNEGDSEE
jgi:hypothetical protein